MVGPERLLPATFSLVDIHPTRPQAAIPPLGFPLEVFNRIRLFENPSYEDFINMDEYQLIKYIRRDLFIAEINVYGDFPNSESKLAFTGGSKQRDISKLKTFEGNPIYNKIPPHHKIDEIDEFLAAADFYLQGTATVEQFTSEAADIFYNFTRLLDLDPRFHDRVPDYLRIMRSFASKLGWTLREALLVTAFKYHKRLVENEAKIPADEDKALHLLFTVQQGRSSPMVPVPEYFMADRAHNFIDRVKRTVTTKRYKDIRWEKEEKLRRKIIYL